MPRIGVGFAALVLLAPALSACETPVLAEPDPAAGSGDSAEEAAATERVRIKANVKDGARDVPVSRLVAVRAARGSLQSVRVSSSVGELPGTLAEDGSRWKATERLEPGVEYTVRAIAENDAGESRRQVRGFHTVDLNLSEQTFPSISPLDGETVGVGMPVIVSFDIAVTDRATIEKHLEVTSSPRQAGTWHWVSDTEVHWRPRKYWKGGTEVTVDADINGVPAGEGIFGQESRSISFTVGDTVIHRIDVARHRLRTFINGDLARTFPISGGKAGFETRSGTKVIIEKFRHKTMDAATTGISEDDPEYYNIEDVEYALRVTYSGEFLHAAPWSVGSQGSANVSHGCVGLSTADARWVYENSRRGDVVEVTGTDRQMDLYNGWGDWNASFAEYKAGSAL